MGSFNGAGSLARFQGLEVMRNSIVLGSVALAVVPICGEGTNTNRKASVVEIGVALTEFVESVEDFRGGSDNIGDLNLVLSGWNSRIIGVKGARSKADISFEEVKGFEEGERGSRTVKVIVKGL